jgi:pimeloyl-ACP methyl ester carboxylesterase
MTDTTTMITSTGTTQTVRAANGIDYAYRRVGTAADGRPPLVLFQHFRGNLDNWDPALVAGLAAAGREVVLFDNTGVGATTGRTPSTVAQMAADAILFLEALELDHVDLLGFSLGGFVAQEIALVRPGIARRIVLAGTGPKGAPRMHGWREDVAEHARADHPTPDDILYIFFAHTDTSRAKGVEFLQRVTDRAEDRDTPTTIQTRDAQYDAVLEWGIPDTAALQRLTAIRHRTLVVQGDDDLMIPTPMSHVLAGLIPDASIRIYPDAAHASLFQYPEQVAADMVAFLDAD